MLPEFTEGRPYAMEAENGKSFVTKQYVVASHGKAEREWPFIMCSNAPLTEVGVLRRRTSSR